MKKIKNILILAGGDSSRFWPLQNKNLFEFIGKSLLLYQQENASDLGENIFIVVKNEVKYNLPYFKNKVQILTQQNPSGMGQAVLTAKGKIKGEVLILNASDVFNFKSLKKSIQDLIDTKPDIGILAKKFTNFFPGGYLKLEGSNLIKIIEKPPPDQRPSNLVKLVVDYFKDFNALIHALEKTKSSFDDQYEQAINRVLRQFKNLKYQEYSDAWYPLKYPWQVLPLLQFFLKPSKKQVLLGKNVKIAKTAKIVGPCFIGDNSIIGDFTLIRSSQIGQNCLIGGYSEVTRSYLGNNILLHRNFVGDSVLGNNVQMGADATIANFRFDEKPIKSLVGDEKIDTNLIKFGAIIGESSKIGVNATLLPGVKIGKNTFVGPGHTIRHDIPDKKFVFKNAIINNLTI